MCTKHPIQEFDGRKFYHRPGGYYKADHARFGTCYMHRYVWEFHNGPIPPKHDVHHKDGVRSNNSIDNLELMCRSAHHSHHMRERLERNPEGWKPSLELAREAAKEWHASDEGRQWHSEHAKRVAADQVASELNCTHCGKEYEGYLGKRKRGFCSPSCQTAARVASGIDDELRPCTICGTEFSTNKYGKVKTCSKGCWKTAISETRRLRNGG